MEILTYASDYIKCVDGIYEATIKVNHDAYKIGVFDSLLFRSLDSGSVSPRPKKKHSKIEISKQ